MLARLAALRAKWRVFMLWTRGRPLGIGQPRAKFLDPFRVVIVPRYALDGSIGFEFAPRVALADSGNRWAVFSDAFSVVLVMRDRYERYYAAPCASDQRTA